MPLYMYCILFAGFEVKYKMKNEEKKCITFFLKTHAFCSILQLLQFQNNIQGNYSEYLTECFHVYEPDLIVWQLF